MKILSERPNDSDVLFGLGRVCQHNLSHWKLMEHLQMPRLRIGDSRTIGAVPNVAQKKTNSLSMTNLDRANTSMMTMKYSRLAGVFNELYAKFNRKRYVDPDPLMFLYNYDNPDDRQVVGMIASSLAYGRVSQILKSVSLVLDRLGPAPADFLNSTSLQRLRREFADFKHRFTTGKELAAMLFAVNGAIRRYGSLQECFLARMNNDEQTVADAVGRFIANLTLDTNNHCGSLLPQAAGRSACKRLNLFLRWMVRSDAVDPGGWNGISPDKLIVPLDTHMHKIGLLLGFTRRKNVDMRTALEITSGFRAIEPADPVKFDFALTRLGIRDDTDLDYFLERINHV